MRGVKYIGPVWDGSGYGEACRNYILALHEAGVPLTVEARRFEANPPQIGTSKERVILSELEGKDIEFNVVIVHLTPDLLPPYKKKYPDKYVISYTVWETSLLHPLWVSACNEADEVFVPCDWNVKSFRDSGVTVPIHKVHHGIDPTAYDNVVADGSIISANDPGTFVFYSIFQWNARKNPEGLLRAYFNAFTDADKVRLVLKTYVGRGMPPKEEFARIKEVILRVKNDMQLEDLPRLSLITDSLSTDKLRTFNKACDAYVSLTHGEGFGLTMLEAGLAGKPVIATGIGGNMEYMTHDNSYPVPYQWSYVHGMSSFNSWYLGNQQWADPDLTEASRLMRHVYDNREEAAARGAQLREDVISKFNWKVVAEQMLNRLKEL